MMAAKINVENSARRYKINRSFIEAIARRILKSVIAPRGLSLEIVFMTDKAMRPLNKRYKGIDRPTDVLSFKIDMAELSPGAVFGEILISLDTARRNAGRFKTSFEEEVVLYVIHGILHLFGYDDENKKDRERMWKRQEKILTILKNRVNLSEVLMPR